MQREDGNNLPRIQIQKGNPVLHPPSAILLVSTQNSGNCRCVIDKVVSVVTLR